MTVFGKMIKTTTYLIKNWKTFVLEHDPFVRSGSLVPEAEGKGFMSSTLTLILIMCSNASPEMRLSSISSNLRNFVLAILLAFAWKLWLGGRPPI